MVKKIDGLTIVESLSDRTKISTAEPVEEIAAAVAAGEIVIIKGAFDPAELRQARTAIIESNTPYGSEEGYNSTLSYRVRMVDPPQTKVKQSFDNYLIALHNPDDALGRMAGSPFRRMASYWRALTAGTHTFAPAADGKAIRPWAMYYPAGGGHLDWHRHRVEPTKVGFILALSEIGVDFHTGGTDFKTPTGIVSTLANHDIGDLCLFRYDLHHRVVPVDPDRERRWDGAGRWTFIIPVQ
jgi:hypothetical protein